MITLLKISVLFHVHAGRQLHQLYGLKHLIFMLAPQAKCSLIHRFDVSDVQRKSVCPVCVYKVYAHTRVCTMPYSVGFCFEFSFNYCNISFSVL